MAQKSGMERKEKSTYTTGFCSPILRALAGLDWGIRFTGLDYGWASIMVSIRVPQERKPVRFQPIEEPWYTPIRHHMMTSDLAGLEVSILDVGKICETQRVMSGWLDQSIPRSATLVGHSQSAVVSLHQKCSMKEKGWWAAVASVAKAVNAAGARKSACPPFWWEQ